MFLAQLYGEKAKLQHIAKGKFDREYGRFLTEGIIAEDGDRNDAGAVLFEQTAEIKKHSLPNFWFLSKEWGALVLDNARIHHVIRLL